MTTEKLTTDLHRQLLNMAYNYRGDHDFQVVFGTAGLMDYLAAERQRGSLLAVAGSLTEFLKDVTPDRGDDQPAFSEFLNKVAEITESLLTSA